MSVENNKALLKRQTEELWMQKDASKVDEFFAEIVIVGASSIPRSELKELLADWFEDEKRADTVKTDYHDMVGEGDIVAARQTNHMSDGTTVNGVTIAHFKEGRITAHYWFDQPEM